ELQDERIKTAVKLLALKESTLSEVVRPIYEVVMIDEVSTVGQALQRMKESGFTKLPVYRKRVDDITGYVDMFDIIDNPSSASIKEFIKPLAIFSEFTTLQDTLETFRKSKARMGLVVDERGIILGIVTFDDIVREVLGQIGDSLIQSEEPIKEIEKEKWIVDGMVDKHEFEKVAGIKFPDGPYLTLGGFIIYQLKRIPHKGEVIICCGLKFVVIQSDGRKVKKLMVEKYVQEQKA
ncbi:MAG: transporter associated domain-containing protein, partial [Hydrogenobacter sp.]